MEWRRDAVDMYAFHLQDPPTYGARRRLRGRDGLAADGTVNGRRPAHRDESLLILEWHQVVLYPADSDTDQLRYQTRVKLPLGWSYATALRVAPGAADNLSFEPTSLTTLIDSTLIAGRYFQSFDLGGAPQVRLHVAADGPAALNLTPEVIAHYKQLVIEARALFGATHYQHYDFLYVLTDQIMPDGRRSRVERQPLALSHFSRRRPAPRGSRPPRARVHAFMER